MAGKGILGEHPFTDRGGNLEAQSRLCHHLHIRYDMDTEHFINIVEQYLGEVSAILRALSLSLSFSCCYHVRSDYTLLRLCSMMQMHNVTSTFLVG